MGGTKINPAEVIEDVEFMAEHDVGMHEAAKRLGRSFDALERFLYAHKRHDLVRKLRSHDWLALDVPGRYQKKAG